MAPAPVATAGHLIEPACLGSGSTPPSSSSSSGEGLYGGQVEPALPQRNHGADSRHTRRDTHDDAANLDHDDTATRSRVTRVDASTRVNSHDLNADTLLGPASGP